MGTHQLLFLMAMFASIGYIMYTTRSSHNRNRDSPKIVAQIDPPDSHAGYYRSLYTTLFRRLSLYYPPLEKKTFDSIARNREINVMDTIDDIVMGNRIEVRPYYIHTEPDSPVYEIVTEALFSTLLHTTPDCMRINLEKRENKHGHVYYKKTRIVPHPYDAYRVDISKKIISFVIGKDHTEKEKALGDIKHEILHNFQSVHFCDNLHNLMYLTYSVLYDIEKNLNRIHFITHTLKKWRKIEFYCFV